MKLSVEIPFCQYRHEGFQDQWTYHMITYKAFAALYGSSLGVVPGSLLLLDKIFGALTNLCLLVVEVLQIAMTQ